VRSDLSQAWLILTLVSIVQKHVHNLALSKDWLWWLSIFISHRYYIAYHLYRISNTTKYTAVNYLTGSIPTEIGSLTSLTDLSFCKYRAKNMYITLLCLNDWLWRLSIFISHRYYIAYHLYRISNTTKYTAVNYLTGSIPTEIGSLTSLTDLSFSKYRAKNMYIILLFLNDWLWWLSIFISHRYYIAYHHLYRISNTAKYTEYNSSFSGSIPTEIGSLTSLTYLDFGKCRAKTCT